MHVYRLRNIFIHPGLKHTAFIKGCGTRSQGDDMHIGCINSGLTATNSLGRISPAENRHLIIHENEIEGAFS